MNRPPCTTILTACTIVLGLSLAVSAGAFKHRGVSLAAYTAYGYYNAQPTLDRLVRDGVDSIAVNVFLYQDTATSTDIYAHPDKTALPGSVREFIGECRRRGIRVVLKVNVDSLDEAWRGTFTPTDLDAWFSAYTAQIVAWAELAEEEGVASFVVGCEYKSLSGHTERWRAVIAAVHAVFSGTLTYAANWDEAWDIAFWDDLDYLSLDAYVPLHYSDAATVDDIRDAWRDSRAVGYEGRDWIGEIDALRQAWGMDVVFMELGYPARDGALAEPWNWELPTLNVAVQSNAYAGAIAAWENVDWFRGFYAWRVPPKMEPESAYDFLDRPAEQVLRAAYTDGRVPADPTVPVLVAPGAVTLEPRARPPLAWAYAVLPRYERFDFETGTGGWHPETWAGDEGFTIRPLSNTTDRAATGRASLQAYLRLKSGDAHWNNGVLWVDLPAPQDFSSRTVSFRAWLPAGLAGSWNRIRLVFQDPDWHYADSRYWHISTVGQWRQYTVFLPDDIRYDTGMDWTRVQRIGIKIGSGENEDFSGYCYFDDVDFRAGAGVSYELQVAADDTFTSPSVNTAVVDLIHHTPVNALPFGRNYARVRADEGGGWGDWSATTDFIVVNTNPVVITSLSLTGEDAAIGFTNATPDLGHILEWTEALADGDWTPIGELVATNPAARWQGPVTNQTAQGFLRVRLGLPE